MMWHLKICWLIFICFNFERHRDQEIFYSLVYSLKCLTLGWSQTKASKLELHLGLSYYLQGPKLHVLLSRVHTGRKLHLKWRCWDANQVLQYWVQASSVVTCACPGCDHFCVYKHLLKQVHSSPYVGISPYCRRKYVSPPYPKCLVSFLLFWSLNHSEFSVLHKRTLLFASQEFPLSCSAKASQEHK